MTGFINMVVLVPEDFFLVPEDFLLPGILTCPARASSELGG